MKNRINMMMIAALAVWGGGMAEAQVVGGLTSCGFNSATGTFAFRSIGTGLRDPKDKTSVLSVIFLGVMVLDGSGGGSVLNTGSVDGFIIPDNPNDRPKITYTVNRDCTGTLTFTASGGTNHYFMVIADNGKKILAMITDPGFVYSMEATRQ